MVDERKLTAALFVAFNWGERAVSEYRYLERLTSDRLAALVVPNRCIGAEQTPRCDAMTELSCDTND
ncbi:MAG: hypothetical protein RI568_00490 [Natronomonas sp.]|nr:hypothetical protein [Natronomonas sp.]